MFFIGWIDNANKIIKHLNGEYVTGLKTKALDQHKIILFGTIFGNNFIKSLQQSHGTWHMFADR